MSRWEDDSWIEPTIEAMAFVLFLIFGIAGSLLISVAILRSVW